MTIRAILEALWVVLLFAALCIPIIATGCAGYPPLKGELHVEIGQEEDQADEDTPPD